MRLDGAGFDWRKGAWNGAEVGIEGGGGVGKFERGGF